MASKYIPPHMRGAAAPAAPAAPVAAPPAESQSHTDWLRSQQSRYTVVVKTPEQLRAECAAMTFEQLRSRAGPPPNVRGDEFVWSSEGCAPDNTGSGEKSSFDSNMGFFKRGQGPPPGPLDHNQRDYEGSNRRVNAYCEWYTAWGVKLWNKWYEEHPRPVAKPKTTKPKKTLTDERKEPTLGQLAALAADIGEKSGW